MFAPPSASRARKRSSAPRAPRRVRVPRHLRAQCRHSRAVRARSSTSRSRCSAAPTCCCSMSPTRVRPWRYVSFWSTSRLEGRGMGSSSSRTCSPIASSSTASSNCGRRLASGGGLSLRRILVIAKLTGVELSRRGSPSPAHGAAARLLRQPGEPRLGRRDHGGSRWRSRGRRLDLRRADGASGRRAPDPRWIPAERAAARAPLVARALRSAHHRHLQRDHGLRLRPDPPWAVASGSRCGAHERPFGLAVGAVSPHELEGVLILIGVVACSSRSIRPSSRRSFSPSGRQRLLDHSSMPSPQAPRFPQTRSTRPAARACDLLHDRRAPPSRHEAPPA